MPLSCAVSLPHRIPKEVLEQFKTALPLGFPVEEIAPPPEPAADRAEGANGDGDAAAEVNTRPRRQRAGLHSVQLTRLRYY